MTHAVTEWEARGRRIVVAGDGVWMCGYSAGRIRRPLRAARTRQMLRSGITWRSVPSSSVTRRCARDTSVPCAPFAPSRVTLLGDAIHAMSPTLGRGANMALRDAASLARQLIAASRGELGLLDAVAAYEGEMLRRGFDTVRRSAAVGARMMGQAPLEDDTAST